MSDPKAEDLRLPMAVLSRVMKSCLPNGAAVSKDARTQIMHACAVFILYLLSQAEEHATSKKRKTVNVEDVMVGLKTAGFESMHETLHEAFECYKASKTSKVKTARKRGANLPDVNEIERPPQPLEQGWFRITLCVVFTSHVPFCLFCRFRCSRH
ncbi:hypothetical protein Aduo_013768 [Ancylostoma duodenale]